MSNKVFLSTMYGQQLLDMHRDSLARTYFMKSISKIIFPPVRENTIKTNMFFRVIHELNTVTQFTMAAKYKQILVQCFNETFKDIISYPIRDMYKNILTNKLDSMYANAHFTYMDSVAYFATNC